MQLSPRRRVITRETSNPFITSVATFRALLYSRRERQEKQCVYGAGVVPDDRQTPSGLRTMRVRLSYVVKRVRVAFDEMDTERKTN